MLPSRGLIFWNCIKFRSECPPQYLCTVWVKSDVESYQSDKSQRQDIKVFVLKHYTLKITVSQHVKLEVNGKMVGNTFPSASGGQAPYRKIAPLGDCMGKPITCPSYASGLDPGEGARGPCPPPAPVRLVIRLQTSTFSQQWDSQILVSVSSFPKCLFCGVHLQLRLLR